MITKIIAEELIQKAKKYVEKGDKFVIVTHVSPDGDALGASLGLQLLYLTIFRRSIAGCLEPKILLCMTNTRNLPTSYSRKLMSFSV